MACPQKENGYTSIANEIMEALAKIRIPGEARQVLDVILRHTYGFNRKSVTFKPGFIAKATNLKRQNINRSINKLKFMNIINVIKTDYGREISINKDYEKWNKNSVINIDYVIKTDYGRNQNGLRASSILTTHINNKETLKKKESKNPPKNLIPKNFTITNKMREWFEAQNFQFIEIENATAEFIDYWKSEGKQKKDWVATWRNGMRNKEKWAKRDHGGKTVDKPEKPKTYKPKYRD